MLALVKVKYFITLFVVTLIAAGGCKREERSIVVTSRGETGVASEFRGGEGAQNGAFLGRLLNEGRDLYYGGKTNDALALLDRALVSSEATLGGEERYQIFNMLLSFQLESGRIEDAKKMVIGEYEKGSELGKRVCGTVYYHLNEHEGAKSALEWIDRVLKCDGLSAYVRANMEEWRILSLIALDDFDGICKTYILLLKSSDAENAARNFKRLTETLLDRGRFEDAAELLKKSDLASTTKVIAPLMDAFRLRYLAEVGAWEDFGTLLSEKMSVLSDAELLPIIRRTIPIAIRNKNYAMADDVALSVVTNSLEKPMSYEYAIRQWIGMTEYGKNGDLPERLSLLVSQNRAMEEVASLFVRYGYDGELEKFFIFEMKAIGEKILPTVQNEDLRSTVRMLILDYCFLLEDYDRAISLIEDGFSIQDEKWHAMSLAKVRAHKALKEKRPLEAITHFRAFMEVVAFSEEETSDPSTGIVHTKEMILGRNAKRIGDIYLSVNENLKADAAYKEARSYYETTLNATKDPEIVALVKEELAALPQEPKHK